MFVAQMPALASDPSGDRDERSKPLNAIPGLRERVQKSEVYQKLKETLPHGKINDRTYYFAEGDLRLDDDQLILYAVNRQEQNEKFEQAKKGLLPREGVPLPNALLASAASDGRIARWAPGMTLTYCVLKKTFNEHEYKKVVLHITKASEEWSKICNIKFAHATKFDDALDTDGPPPEGVLFCVKKAQQIQDVVASAFFPTSPVSERQLLVFPLYFEAAMPYDQVGVFRHELGHILTFRHEHIRSEAPPVCGTGEPLANAVELTDYDPRSVMHYFCPDGRVGSKAQEITNLDKLGAALVYPFVRPAASQVADSAYKNHTR